MDKDDDQQAYRYSELCAQIRLQINIAECAMATRKVVESGYSGHHRQEYAWQASQLVPALEAALRLAQGLNPLPVA